MLDRVVKPQVGLGCSVQSPSKVKNNINCGKQSKKPLEYIIKHPIARQQGDMMVERIHEEIDLSMRLVQPQRTVRKRHWES